MIKKKIKGFLLFGFFVVICIITLFPMIVTIADSFMSIYEIERLYGTALFENNKNVYLKLIPEMISLKQYYQILFQSPDYLYKFWNSVFITGCILVFQLIVALFAAYGFTRNTGRKKEIIFFIYIILMLLPYQVTLVPNYLVAKWLHILGSKASIIIPTIFSPFSVYLLTKSMRRIPIEIYEAARLDGASEFEIFIKICTPLCKNILISVGMLVYFDCWNMVEQPILLLKSVDQYPLSVFLSQINKGEIGIAFAASTIYMIPCILLFLYGSEELRSEERRVGKEC